MNRFVGESASTILLWDTTKWETTKRPRALSVRVPAFPRHPNQADVTEGRLLEKEPANLQAQSLNDLIEDKATRGEPPPKHHQKLTDASS